MLRIVLNGIQNLGFFRKQWRFLILILFGRFKKIRQDFIFNKIIEIAFFRSFPIGCLNYLDVKLLIFLPIQWLTKTYRRKQKLIGTTLLYEAVTTEFRLIFF